MWHNLSMILDSESNGNDFETDKKGEKRNLRKRNLRIISVCKQLWTFHV